jgi:putative transposase
MVDIRHNKHSIGQLAYHLVWRPKYNVSVFSEREKHDYMVRALCAVAARWKIEVYEIEVMNNHVHLFVEISPTMSVSFALQILKGGSAKLFFRRFPEWRKYFHRGHKKAHLWSPGKFFRSVGTVTSEAVRNYIKNSNNWDFEYLKKYQIKLKAVR